MAESKKKSKDPDALLDYTWNWEPWLGEDTIGAYEFIVPNDLTLETQSSTDTTVTAWLSGGEVAATGEDPTIYLVVCRITTTSSPGRRNDWTMKLKVSEQ